ncbi:hypothetical protein RR46_10528, partial [Papilio xuthus]
FFQILGLFVLGSCLESTTEHSEKNQTEEEMKNIILKYVENIKDIESQYVINEALSKSISHYLNGKVNVLPLYRISLKIDRNPIKIPWTIPEKPTVGDNGSKLKYEYIEVKTTKEK